MYYSITIKGTQDKRYSRLVRLEAIFFCTGYNRVPKVIGITGLLKDWNPALQTFTGKDAEEKNAQLERLKTKYLNVIEAWEAEGVELTPVEWSHYFDTGKAEVYSVWRTIDILADRLENQERTRNGHKLTGMKTAESFRALRRSLCTFTKQELGSRFCNYTFDDITERFLLDYVSFLQKQGSTNGTNGNLRTRLKELLRVFNFAAEMNLAKPDMSLFESLQPYIQHKKRIPKTLSPDVIGRIERLDPDAFTRVERFHIDLFLFCCYVGGLSNAEIAYLIRSCVCRNTLTYVAKSGKEVKIPLIDKARKIVKRYARGCYSDYLFPILMHKHNTESKQRDRMKRLCDGVNRTLKKAGRLLQSEETIFWSSAKPLFIAKMLEVGFHPVVIAQYAGVSVDVVYKYCPEQPREKDLLEQMNRAFNDSEFKSPR